MKTSNQKRTRGEIAVLAVYFVLFSLFAILFLYPLFWAFINSLKTGAEFYENSIALPKIWKWINYGRIFTDFKYKNSSYFDMLFNSLWITGVKLFVNLLSSILLAYPIAKYRFPGKNFLYATVIFANTIPLFGAGTAMYKFALKIGLVNNPMLIWLQWASGFDFAFIVFYGTFRGISDSYSEAAYIDGANNFTILFKIVLPQAIPSIVALAITQAIPLWNDYGTCMIYLRNYPNLAYGLYVFNSESNRIPDSRALYFCAVIVSMIPPTLLYAANQKFILTNVTAGGLKG